MEKKVDRFLGLQKRRINSERIKIDRFEIECSLMMNTTVQGEKISN